MSCRGRESHIGFDEVSEKGAERERNAFRFHLEEKCWCGGKRMQTRKKKEKAAEKEWNNDHSLDVVHRQIFVVTRQRYRSNSQFRLLSPKCFPIAALTLAVYGARILRLTVVFNTLNWADVEEMTEMNWIQVDQHLECCMLVFRGDDGSKSSDKLFSTVSDLAV